SALNSLAAISNDIRVRVLGSRKRLTTVLPRSAGTFFTLRSRMARNAPAVASPWVISFRLRSSVVRRCLRFQGKRTSGGSRGLRARGLRRGDDDLVVAAMRRVEVHDDLFTFARGDGETDVVGGKRQAPARTLDEGGEFDALRPAVIEQFVQRRLDGAAG